MIDLSNTIEPNSQQMNADDLIAGPKTIRISRVTASPSSSEQPVSIHYEGDGEKPYKPCKSMRRVMVQLWGVNASKYVGKRMTLYRDPKVTWGGMEVGGIRISHMSDLDAESVVLVLTETKTKRGRFTVRRLPHDEAQTKASKPVEPTQAPGNIEQARTLLTTADVETVETILVSLREFSWTRDEKLEIKRLSDEATKRKRLSNG